MGQRNPRVTGASWISCLNWPLAGLTLGFKMFPPIDTTDARAVAQEIQTVYVRMYPDGDMLFVPRSFGWANDCFFGQYGGYQPIDARYHDMEHTLLVTLCMVRLLWRRHELNLDPPMPRRLFELGLMAILFHDTGYLKTSDDVEGTGAKYTFIHVARSAEFAGAFLANKGFEEADIHAVKNMIQCTGVNVDMQRLSFQSDLERTVGCCLGTGDLLGQMAAEDYVDKLPELYLEFEESARVNPGQASQVGAFSSAEDLLRKTPLFWEKFVLPKLNREFEGCYPLAQRSLSRRPERVLQPDSGEHRPGEDHPRQPSPLS